MTWSVRAGERPLPPLVHLVHTENRNLLGSSTNLIAADPWLAYVFGRALVMRPFTAEDGTTSSRCATCHGSGFEGGPGTSVAEGGKLRDVPSLRGVGLIEMISDAIGQEALRQLDGNGDGWVSLPEADGKEVWISPGSGQAKLFFGRADDADDDGQPDLNSIFEWRFVNAAGEPIAATRLSDALVAGYQLRLAPFQHDGRRTSSLRAVLVQAMAAQTGLRVHDGSFERDPDGDGIARYSPSGALQFVRDRAPDRGLKNSASGTSRNDPDHDGVVEELTEGDIDVGEWYLLNLPKPAVREQGGLARRGAEMMLTMGCIGCHTPSWQFAAANAEHGDVAVDRRFFELRVHELTASHSWQAEVLPLTSGTSETNRRSLVALRTDGIYSDLRTHCINDDPSATKLRTRPLWGVGSTAPYLTDASALTLEDAIRKHGGEASIARAAFESAPTDDQQALLAFLASLTLFSFEELATGSALITVNQPALGAGRFAPEVWSAAFRRHWERQNGQVVLPLLPDAFGMNLPFLRDRDRDGFPDAVDPAPDLDGMASKGF